MSDAKFDPDKLAQIYIDILQNELGLMAHADKDKDVLFKLVDFGTFMLSLDAERDPEYFMLVFPNFASSQSTGLKAEDLYQIANDINLSKKAVKISVRKSDDGGFSMVATAEAFLAGADQAPSGEIIKATLGRYISAIRSGVRAAVDAIEKKQADGTQTPQTM
mgnify:CR=1 FL=1